MWSYPYIYKVDADTIRQIINLLFIGCSDDEFECLSSGFCLAEAQVCDNVVDCPNGEDESVCLTQSSCYLDQFR